ncbi:MAG TPA: hypothetical protein PKM88_06110 [bacterium]|nr:hypothetical protein [bacterium]
MDYAILLTGVNLTIIGMGIVFVMLELLAELMRLTCRIFPEQQTPTPLGAAKKMVSEVGRAVKPLTDAARPLTDAATAVARPLADAATGMATAATEIARPLTQVATEMAMPVARRDVADTVPYQFVATAVLHHYRRKRRRTAVDLFATATTQWRR